MARVDQLVLTKLTSKNSKQFGGQHLGEGSKTMHLILICKNYIKKKSDLCKHSTLIFGIPSFQLGMEFIITTGYAQLPKVMYPFIPFMSVKILPLQIAGKSSNESFELCGPVEWMALRNDHFLLFVFNSYFYWTRVRSLATLVNDSLTNSLIAVQQT